MNKYSFAVSLVLSCAVFPQTANATTYTSLKNCEQVVASNNRTDNWRDRFPSTWLPSNIGEAAEAIDSSPWCSLVNREENHFYVVGHTTDGGVLPLGLRLHKQFKPPHLVPLLADFKRAMKVCFAPADLFVMPEGFVIRQWQTGHMAGKRCRVSVLFTGKLHSEGMSKE